MAVMGGRPASLLKNQLASGFGFSKPTRDSVLVPSCRLCSYSVRFRQSTGDYPWARRSLSYHRNVRRTCRPTPRCPPVAAFLVRCLRESEPYLRRRSRFPPTRSGADAHRKARHPVRRCGSTPVQRRRDRRRTRRSNLPAAGRSGQVFPMRWELRRILSGPHTSSCTAARFATSAICTLCPGVVAKPV